MHKTWRDRVKYPIFAFDMARSVPRPLFLHHSYILQDFFLVNFECEKTMNKNISHLLSRNQNINFILPKILHKAPKAAKFSFSGIFFIFY